VVAPGEGPLHCQITRRSVVNLRHISPTDQGLQATGNNTCEKGNCTTVYIRRKEALQISVSVTLHQNARHIAAKRCYTSITTHRRDVCAVAVLSQHVQ